MRRKGIVLVLILLILSVSSACYAQTAFEKSMRKLGRGVANTVTGWIEVPKQIYEVGKDENIGLGLTYGLVKGVGMGIVRTGAGVIDIVTFPFPINDYEPLLEPEFVFESE